MGVNKYDIKTVRKVIGTTVTSLGLGQVPSGMRRWVTFIRVDNEYGGENALYLASTTGETAVSNVTDASANAVIKILMQAKETYQLPRYGPDIDKPIFSIAESKYLTALTNRGDVNLFIQYYDD